MNSNRCVLAYSGGLDTSAIVVWLIERGYAVHAVLVDVGQDEDLAALCDKAIKLGAASAEVVDMTQPMFETIIPHAISLAATYEGNYRLGTALARPFIALAQIQRAKQLGGATLVHGATGKGNDQIRFEYAYKSLAPECPVVAPWKIWDLRGRKELAEYLADKGFADAYDVNKEFSLDENLWHLSVEGGPLERAEADLDVDEVLGKFADRFATGRQFAAGTSTVKLTFSRGVPVAINDQPRPLVDIIACLNQQYRDADWAWDLVLENRATGIKSRGIYLNPAAKLLHLAVDGLARAVLNKPMYDQYVTLGNQYGTTIYRGEYFTTQRQVLETTAQAVVADLNGAVTIQLKSTPYVATIEAPAAIFSEEMATFEASAYDHKDAVGFINLSWLATVGKTFEIQDENVVATEPGIASDVCSAEPIADGGLVPTSA